MSTAENSRLDYPDPDMTELIEGELQIANDALSHYREQIANYRHDFRYDIDSNYYQDSFCIILFEARAMFQQFQTYTSGLTLCPFGGQPSIPYKWQIAKYIEKQCEKYEKDAVVLYFGDADEGGEIIFEAAKTDIVDWCGTNINFVFCGLTQEQAKAYGVPENPDRPKEYQWEALTDPQAKEIIMQSLQKYYDFTAQAQAARESDVITFRVNEFVNGHF